MDEQIIIADDNVDGVEFEEKSDGFTLKIKMPKLNSIVIKLKLAKDYSSSNKILVLSAIVMAVLAIGIYVYYVADYNPFAKKTVDSSQISPNFQRFLQQSKTIQ